MRLNQYSDTQPFNSVASVLSCGLVEESSLRGDRGFLSLHVSGSPRVLSQCGWACCRLLPSRWRQVRVPRALPSLPCPCQCVFLSSRCYDKKEILHRRIRGKKKSEAENMNLFQLALQFQISQIRGYSLCLCGSLFLRSGAGGERAELCNWRNLTLQMELLNIPASNFTPRMEKKKQTKNKTHKFLNECCEFLLFSHSTHVGQSFLPLQAWALQVIWAAGNSSSAVGLWWRNPSLWAIKVQLIPYYRN